MCRRDKAGVPLEPQTRMRKCAALLLLLLMAVPPLRGQSAAPVTLVKAARLLDPRTGNVLAPAAVLIEGDKVKQVGPSAQLTAPAGSKIIDLGAATLLPGLIDSHTHLFLDIIVPPELEQQRHYNGLFAPGMVLAIIESPSKRVLMGAQLAREDLDRGITTVRNLGHWGLMGTPNCATRLTHAVFLVQEFWLLDANSSPEVRTSKI
jgi:imidazolonepropionase-like amidohydrolase